MPIYLYNTLTRKKEIFKPLKKGRVSFYACGPTVYGYAHIGNFRTYLFEDLLRRVLEVNRFKVKHVMNFTDVGHLTSESDTGDDKIQKSAAKEGKTAKEIADFYIAAFKRDARSLNIKEPNIYARATEHIKEQIDLVKILEEKGFTYKIFDGLYFDTSKLKDYGWLAQLDLAGLKAGARVETVLGKKHPTDFAVWKFTLAGVKRQQEWPSPWGKGFPGWHLECSAMSQKYLGQQFDIHAGAIDLIPIHHTNEIAQSQTAYGKIPARFWVHGEFLMIDGEKMSKSRGDFTRITDINKAFNPLTFRYLNLGAHYRSPINLTWESMEAAQITLQNLYQKMRDLNELSSPAVWQVKRLKKILGLTNKTEKDIFKKLARYREDFLEAINDDLDTPRALSVLWQTLNDEKFWPETKKILLLEWDKIMGLRLADIQPADVPENIKKMVRQRKKLRETAQWLKADILRAQIEQQGWLVEDTSLGSKIIEKRIQAG